MQILSFIGIVIETAVLWIGGKTRRLFLSDPAPIIAWARSAFGNV